MKQAWVKVMLTYFKNECFSLSLSLQISIVAKQLPGGVLTTFPSHIHPGYNILYVYMEQLTMDVGRSSQVPFPFTHSHTDNN